MTRVFVSIDLEGVAGVSDRRQVARGTDDFEEARSLMAGEANAVTAGAFDAGAELVVINDSHGDLCNLRPSHVDDRALLQIGSGKSPHAMIFRADTGFDAAFFVGYHARAGTADAVLEHSYSSATVAGLRVNDQPWGELEFNAAALGAWGVPVLLVAGDDKLCAQAEELLPGVVTVAVKEAYRFRGARSLAPAAACARLRDAAKAALTGSHIAPFAPEPPFRLEVDFLTSAMAEAASVVPGAERSAARTVAITASDSDSLARYRGVLLTMAATALGI